ncbi:hypothetical protein [Oceanisphaera sp. IT1-181]|nr:hypothetical protein [Oceanisphaera sp. IT1-181]
MNVHSFWEILGLFFGKSIAQRSADASHIRGLAEKSSSLATKSPPKALL